MLADRRYCYPLTISDFASRYLFSCEALSSTKETYAFTIFERVFKDFGLPKAIPHRQRRALRQSARALRLEQLAYGGYGSASASSASNPAIPRRRAAMSAST